MSLSSRPYLIRALYDWMSENSLTPQILIDTTAADLQIPPQFIGQGDRLLLNISLSATRDLLLGDGEITFNARFSGVSQFLKVPVDAVLAIIARETESIMIFGNEPDLGVAADVANRLPDEELAEKSVDEVGAGVLSRSDDSNVVHVQFGREPKKK